MSTITRTVPVDGGEIYCEVAGEGPAVLLVHGGLWDSRMWDDQVEALAARYRVIRHDVRGYGRSSRPSASYSDAEDIHAVLAALDVPRAAVIGLSMGGAIGIDFALTHPAMLSALVLAATGIAGYEFSDDLERAYAPVEEALEAGDIRAAAELELGIWAPLPMDDDAGRRIREIAMDNAHQVSLDGSLRMRPAPPPIERLDEIAVPTLVLIGDGDVPDMLAISELVARRIREARREVIAGADHVLNMRAPAEFNRLVGAFLDEVLSER